MTTQAQPQATQAVQTGQATGVTQGPQETGTTGSTLRSAYLTMERMQHRLQEYERARAEPVAIVGLACRFPGGAVDADTYWKVLSHGVDAVDEVPDGRWDVDAFYDKEPQQPGKMSSRWGGFLDRIDQFDYQFFGISKREAVSMDPQQKLALEVAWEALENAGQSPAEVAGSRTGVFLGVCSQDFATENFQHPMDITAYASTGTAHSLVTGRISYLLDLKGPSIAIDSACSSSLVAIHQACQSLRAGECDMALGGGVNVVLSPLPNISFSQFPGMVSADGRCKTFDAESNGYVRGEGCGMVTLKRLSDAVRDGDRVLAVIRGSAVNQDGRSSGVTAPNGMAQRDVIRRALESSGVDPREVSYIEAHGTATRLGDPIEVEALAEVYGREQGLPVFLGSSKTNIGHLEGAAGVAGLIKVVLSLGHDVIPPNVHFTKLNPHISFEGTTFAVPTELTPWPSPADRHRAGVSAFGFSGTNAHVILEQAPEQPQVLDDDRRPASLLALSAKSQPALVELARKYVERLGADSPAPAADLCFSANTGRSHFRHRLATVGATRQELAGRLAEFVAGEPGEGQAAGETGNADVVFLFTGQGPQHVGMARRLYETAPTFRRVLDQCDEILRPILKTPLLSVLYPADPQSDLIHQTTYAQPALFAVEYALSALWRSWGVEPVAVLGHSFGEYIAACVAGAMSLQDGLLLVAERGRLMQTLAGTGAMAAIFAPEMEVAEEISPHRDRIAIAAVNGPANTAISGDRELVTQLCETFTNRGVRAKLLRITTSSHSPLIEPILEPLRQALEKVRFTPPTIPLVSNLDGELWPWDQAHDADYWCRHARQPVQFAAGVGTLRRMGYRNFLEAGPIPTLLGVIGDGLSQDNEALLLPSLRPRQDDWQVMLSTLGRLYARGADIDWRGFDHDYARSRTVVPSYPFAPTHCWKEPTLRGAGTSADVRQASAPRDGAETEAEELEDDDLLYELSWQPGELVAAPDAAPPADGVRTIWLVLADSTGVGDQLSTLIAQRGSRCVRVATGAEYHFDGSAQAVVRPDHPDDLTKLLGSLDLTADQSLQVVHLWSLGQPDVEQDSVQALLDAQQHSCMSAVRAVQALAGAGHPDTAQSRLWLVTRGAVQPLGPGSTAPDLGESTLWGLGRSLQQEHSGIWGGLIDLDPDAAPQALALLLLAEIERHDDEDQIALRDGRRYVARLARKQLPQTPARPTVWRKDASYLITGGLGGIGLAVARSLVRAGARRLILVGRTPIPPRGQWAALAADDPFGRRLAAVQELESLGASVMLESLDVSDEDAVHAFLDRFDREGWPPIRGVVHAAGVGDVTALLDLEPADLERHLRPKSVGAWVLHRQLGDRPLDFFVLFSSTSSILSSPFVASYAAANAFLDSLARLRRSQGKPGLSINWGIWSQTGLAQRGADATPGLSQGMGMLAPDQALRVFHRLLRHDETQVAVMPVDWAQWGRRYQGVTGSTLLASLVEREASSSTRRAGARLSQLPTREELLRLPAGEQLTALTARLLLGVTSTLGSDSAPGSGSSPGSEPTPGSGASAIGPDQPLFDLGLDSLMAVELRNDVQARLAVSLPISVLLQGASVRVLAGEILSRLRSDDGTAEGSGGGPPKIQRVQRREDVAAELLAQIDALAADAALPAEPAPSGEPNRPLTGSGLT